MTVSSQGGEELISKARFSARECGGPGEQRCNFFDGPLQLLSTPVRVASRQQEFFPTANRLGFVDSEASRWVAPRRTLTDGASIPSIFVPIIGARRSPEFVNAAAVHDAYCGIGNETLSEYQSRTWQETHRMFYDALRAGGTEEIRAKVMYAAVYLGGPRWQDDKRNLKTVPVPAMQQTMREARQYILWTKPTPSRAQIEAWLDRREAKMLRGLRRVETRPAFTTGELDAASLADEAAYDGDYPVDGDDGIYGGDGGDYPGEGGEYPGDGGEYPGDGGEYPGDGGDYPSDGDDGTPGDGDDYPYDEGDYPGDGYDSCDDDGSCDPSLGI